MTKRISVLDPVTRRFRIICSRPGFDADALSVTDYEKYFYHSDATADARVHQTGLIYGAQNSFKTVAFPVLPFAPIIDLLPVVNSSASGYNFKFNVFEPRVNLANSPQRAAFAGGPRAYSEFDKFNCQVPSGTTVGYIVWKLKGGDY